MKEIDRAVGFYHSLERFGMQPGLDRITALCDALGHPERQFRCVHVAGTNGKGTVCTEISNILREAGVKSGLYTSPYVLDFRERIQINNCMISEPDLISITDEVIKAVLFLNQQEIYPTEFEAVTAAAFLYFAKNKCKIVVLETGLGGRFDATNIITNPVVSVITSISLDHVRILGNTVAEIAFEKCGIIKPLCHCVADASNPAEARQVITDACLQRGSYLFEAVPDEMFETLSSDINGTMIKYRGKEIRIPFVGQHQVRNAAVAIKACEVIGVNGIDITLTHIKKGLESSFIPARTEIISFNPTVLLDGSHNDDSTKALADVIHKYLPDKRIFAVMGMMADKDCKKALLNLSGCFSKVIAVTPSNPRAMQAEDFCRLLLEAGFDASVQQDPKKAIDEAIAKISEYDALIVCGSLYLASDVREYLIKKFRSL